MASLRLTLDATGMRAGAVEAQRALSDLDRAGQGTAAKVDEVSRALRTAGDAYSGSARTFTDGGRAIDGASQSFSRFNHASVGVASEALQIGGRVRLVTQEFQALGTGAGDVSRLLIVAGQGLIDFVQIGERLKAARLAEQVGETATGFQKFVGIISRNPLLTVTIAVGALAAAMSLLGKGTDEAAKSTEALNKAVEQLDSQRFQDKLKTDLGIPLPKGGRETGELSVILQAIEDLSRGTGPVPLRQVARITGQTVGEAADRYGPNVTYGPAPALTDLSRAGIDRIASGQLETQGEAQVGRLFAIEQLKQQAQGLTQQQGPDTRALDEYIASLKQETELLGQSEEKRQQNIAVIQAENIAKQAGIPISETIKASIREEIALQQQLVQAQQLARAAAETIGASFFSIVNGANNARQAVAQLIQQLAQLAQQQVIRGIGDAAAGLFRSTPAQLQNPNTIPGGIGPQQLDPNAIG